MNVSSERKSKSDDKMLETAVHK